MIQENKFNGKKFYHMMHPDSPNHEWDNLVIHNKARPRAVFTFWMLCHRKLPTRMRLFRWGMVNSTVCTFCDQDETIDHLFFDCCVTQRIWKGVLNWMHIQHESGNWEHELKWLLLHYRGKGWRAELMRMEIAETVYEV
ncbi:uncharacterized protein LOC131649882 [Vicia villosa]|uniref:uncharacterized protein LOC131649882 n=1 Tax=Vicia villosa TaxID=3911 RepID=UPI00273BB738|nr:uncharacterized protein LOC131649882 [Vicia villosa]